MKLLRTDWNPESAVPYNNTNQTNTRYSGRLNATYGGYWGVNTLNVVAGMQISDNHPKAILIGCARVISTDQFSSPNSP